MAEEGRRQGFYGSESGQDSDESWEKMSMDSSSLPDNVEEELPLPPLASPSVSSRESLTVEAYHEKEAVNCTLEQTDSDQRQHHSSKEVKELCNNAADVKAGGGAFYDKDYTPYSIRLLFTPDGNTSSSSSDNEASKLLPSSGWWAEMFIRCDVVPQLMREGLHWTDKNIMREEGHFDFGPIPYPWGPIARTYYLRDLDHAPPRWTASMQVHAHRVAPLSRFRPGRLTPERHLTAALARAPNGAAIYSWCSWAPDEAYNALYDDMPLEGWWPWPKKRPEEEDAATTKTSTESGSSSRETGSRERPSGNFFEPANSGYIREIYLGVHTVNPELEGQRGGL
ncbi:hypothetical protein PG985_003363 [Apiospora marii]|uniref:Uncharacterized protein n=1 Tax=Apiospora marii TaxID=335849 RepID=A0ABR1RVH7_9PEZI